MLQTPISILYIWTGILYGRLGFYFFFLCMWTVKHSVETKENLHKNKTTTKKQTVKTVSVIVCSISIKQKSSNKKCVGATTNL